MQKLGHFADIKGKVCISCHFAALVFPSQDFPDHTFLPLTYALLLRIPDSVPLSFRNSYLSLLKEAQELKNHHVEIALPSQTNCLHPFSIQSIRHLSQLGSVWSNVMAVLESSISSTARMSRFVSPSSLVQACRIWQAISSSNTC